MTSFKERLKNNPSFNDYIAQSDWDYFVALTLDGKNNYTLAQLRNTLMAWHANCSRKIWGSHTKERLTVFPVIDWSRTGRPHCHMLMCHPIASRLSLSTTRLRTLCGKTWKSLRYTGKPHINANEEWFKEATTEDMSRIVSYSLKTCRDNDSFIPEMMPKYKKRIV